MKLTVNGDLLEVTPLPGEMLADLLRERLGLTGTKIACNEAECGACTVLVDGQPVLACTYPAAKAEGRRVLTIEGLAGLVSPQAGAPGLHPLQQAFIQTGAVQCGFCTPGQIMTAYALLQATPQPSEAEIRQALKDTLCRCAGYPAIIRALQSAAHSPAPQPSPPSAVQGEAVIGAWQPRPDAVAKVTGTALYTDDLKFAGMLHARVKRAGLPHAIVKRIDITRACALPGVAAVLTAAHLPGEKYHGLVVKDWPILVGEGERVRYVGDALALVAAESRPIAAQALALIDVELEPQPVVADPIFARDPAAPRLHPQGNLLKHIKVRKGDVRQGFAEAEVVLEHTFHTPMMDHAFMEPECAIACPVMADEGDGQAVVGMQVYVGSQIPYADRYDVARALGLSEARVRVIGQVVGGGFGGKEDIAGQIHAALLAQASARPVKLLFDRQESLLVHPKRHATQVRVKLGAKRDGRLTAVETELYGDTGAYASLGEKVLTRATTHSAGPYDAPHVKADCYAMYTNNPPAGAFRGFGVLQSAFAIESMIDRLAETLHIDPVTLRRINALRVGSVTNTGQTLTESVGLLECIEKVEAAWQQRLEASRREPLGDGDRSADSGYLALTDDEVTGWGFACAYKNTGLGGGAPDKAGAEVELYPDGAFEVRTASAELGQGLVTVIQMIVAEEFHQPLSRVRVLVMDTELTPDGGPTTASRQTYVTGNAVRHAAIALRQSAAAVLAEKYDCPPEHIEFVEGLALVRGQPVSLGEVASLLRLEGRQPRARVDYWAPETHPLSAAGEGVAAPRMHFAYSFAAQAVEVAVNRRTGEVRVLRVIAANDVGKALNPLGLQGQVEGGIMMGIGHTLTEAFIVEQGQVITDRLARYRIPGIALTPEITSIVVEHPTAEGPYGAKGAGELVTIPTPAAICNAIYHAVGVRVDRLPVDQEQILVQMTRQ